MESLTGLINTYSKTDHWNSDDITNTRINNNHNNRAEERAPPMEKAFQGRAHLKTDIKETNNIQKKTDIDRNLRKLELDRAHTPRAHSAIYDCFCVHSYFVNFRKLIEVLLNCM